MYEILCRSTERPWAMADWAMPARSVAPPASQDLVLHMRENRSQLSNPARQTLAVVVTLLMACTILPALKGLWLVPVFCLTAMAALTFALDTHAKRRPNDELLTFGDGYIRHRNVAGEARELPSHFTRLHAEEASPTSLRLFLKHRDHAIEIGRCLGLDEKRALLPVIAAALSQTRERGR